MKLNFNFEMSDWMEFQKIYLLNSKQFKRSKFIAKLIIPIFFLILISIDLIKGEFFGQVLLVYIIISAVWVIYIPKRIEKSTLNKARKMIQEGDNSSILGNHEIELLEDEIKYKDPGGEQKTTWDRIIRFEETDNYYFLFNTSVSAFVIPRFKLNFKKDEFEKLDKLIKLRLKI
ncbi:MAG: YcxB family protein [Bacteroidales bacterium]|nr:YcxB family protein [Bacteroidales bacterium]